MPVIRYIDQFSRCLYVEYKKSGIDVQCQVLSPILWSFFFFSLSNQHFLIDAII